MKTICAWCGKELDKGSDDTDVPISHGICHECSANLLSKSAGSLSAFLDTLDYPVLLVDSDVKTKSENKKLRELTGKAEVDIVDKKGGEVFNCRNRSNLQECGRSIKCKTCSIRRSVEDTYKTGTPHIDVPSTLKVYVQNSEDYISNLITTEKVGDYVLLSIKDVDDNIKK